MGKRGPQPRLTPDERAQRRKRRPHVQAYNTAWVRQHRSTMTPEEHQAYRERQNAYQRRWYQRKRAERLTLSQPSMPPKTVSPTKRCSRCAQEKPRESFYHSKGRIRAMCKTCDHARVRDYLRRRRE